MKLLITGALKLSNELKKYIEKIGFEILFLQDEKKIYSLDFSTVEGVICNTFFLYNDIKKFKNLKFIQLTSAGLERIPLDYIKKNKIEIFRASKTYHIPMAEWIIFTILFFYKEMRFFENNKSKHLWIKNRNLLELSRKKVCILGCGEIGIEVAKRLYSFDCEIVGIDIIEKKYKSEYFKEILLLNSLNDVLRVTDILILTLPLNKETENIIDKEELFLLKPDSIIVNVSRGKLINQEFLIERLKGNYLKGAILDVFEEEPLNEKSELWDLDNVIISPHNSFVSDGIQVRLENIITENLKKYITLR